MSHLLLYYQRPEPATWVFLATFLLLSIYFVFHRFFSIRNLDIALLVLLAPGLMMVYEGRQMRVTNFEASALETLASSEHELDEKTEAVAARPAPSFTIAEKQASSTEQAAVSANAEQRRRTAHNLEFYGFVALLIACALLTLRMLLDPLLVRRPLLVPNLSIGGLSFIGISLFLFLMSNVITSSPRELRVRGPSLGPGYAMLNMVPELPTTPSEQEFEASREVEAPPSTKRWLPNLARTLAIFSNMAIVLGIIGIGYWHFDNVQTGIGCAVMYLLLPYSAQMTGNLQHAMPAALLVLAMLAYRQPLLAGILLGAASGLVYYPLFLLPLWISFYWHRGLTGLLVGVCTSLLVMAGLLLLQGFENFFDHFREMFGLWVPRMERLEGIWGAGGIQPAFRLPVLVGFILLSLSFVFWPSLKNLGTLMCGTAAVMLAAQFWHGNGGGLFMAWFLPFVLLTIFRPNLDDRIATNMVKGGWLSLASKQPKPRS
ncbi:hypothetical protein [Aureliella helgolandensis]|uniref:Uncharacterized protein n=1 Tax=Aureliella helgolandensis TaxID=2527968 RepID=A0A518G4E7_9BACT|nr:hypothetical protein [Aureliella helgolandensis]QDV23474.1 hypothetical protein Q31a_17730 [Aureliella helgolandensis]